MFTMAGAPMNIGKRLVLLVIYLVVAFGIVAFFLWPGEGSGTPILIFGSWGVALTNLSHPPVAIGVFILLLYFSFIFFINTALGKWADKPFSLVSVLIHGIGCAVGASIRKPQTHPMPGMETMAIIVSILIVGGYFVVDWLLAMAPTTPKPTDP